MAVILCKFHTHTSRLELHIFAAGASKFHTSTASQSQAAQHPSLIATVVSDEDAVAQSLEGPAPQPAPSRYPAPSGSGDIDGKPTPESAWTCDFS